MTTSAPRAVTGDELVDRYAPGAFLFATSDSTMLCEGPLRPIGGGDQPDRLGEAARSALCSARHRGDSPPRVVGAIPFDTEYPATLAIPETVHVAKGRRFPIPARRDPGHSGEYRISARPSPRDHVRAVERALRELRSDPELDKIVLARTLCLDGDEPADAHRILANLASGNPDAYVFAADVPTGSGHARVGTLAGASPELLVSRSGRHVHSHPLAGSAARGRDAEEDRRRADALLESAKDRAEHAIVVEGIAQALRPFCDELRVPPEPALRSTPRMWHLATEITGTLARPSTTALDLALALHPTAAVCGKPTERARRAIGRIEAFDRGFYGGLVGWCDADGDGEWAIAIRCAEIDRERIRLFAGGGIVAESDPESELAETTAKLATMMDAIGVAGA